MPPMVVSHTALTSYFGSALAPITPHIIIIKIISLFIFPCKGSANRTKNQIFLDFSEVQPIFSRSEKVVQIEQRTKGSYKIGVPLAGQIAAPHSDQGQRNPTNLTNNIKRFCTILNDLKDFSAKQTKKEVTLGAVKLGTSKNTEETKDFSVFRVFRC
jgi:hypothetical protein